MLAAYDAPFPDAAFTAGLRQMTALLPLTRNDVGARIGRRTMRALEAWERPFVTAYSDGDPATRGWETVFQERVPGARGRDHVTIAGAGHFLQEDAGPELGRGHRPRRRHHLTSAPHAGRGGRPFVPTPRRSRRSPRDRHETIRPQRQNVPHHTPVEEVAPRPSRDHPPAAPTVPHHTPVEEVAPRPSRDHPTGAPGSSTGGQGGCDLRREWSRDAS